MKCSRVIRMSITHGNMDAVTLTAGQEYPLPTPILIMAAMADPG